MTTINQRIRLGPFPGHERRISSFPTSGECVRLLHICMCVFFVCVSFQQVMRHTNSKVDVNPIFICFSKGHSFTLIISILYLPRRLAFHFSLLYLSFFPYVSSVLRLFCLSLDPRCLIFFWFFFFFVFIISLFPKDIGFI